MKRSAQIYTPEIDIVPFPLPLDWAALKIVDPALAPGVAVGLAIVGLRRGWIVALIVFPLLLSFSSTAGLVGCRAPTWACASTARAYLWDLTRAPIPTLALKFSARSHPRHSVSFDAVRFDCRAPRDYRSHAIATRVPFWGIAEIHCTLPLPIPSRGGSAL